MRDWLSQAAGLFPAKDYIITGNITLSFQVLNEKAIYLAHYLQKNYNIKRGDTAAILSKNNFDFILLLFALWKSGAVPVPINIRLNDPETNNLLAYLKPNYIFTVLGNHKPAIRGAINIEIGTDYHLPVNTEIPGHDIITDNAKTLVKEENQAALILFTSGTSGDPKGVQLSFHNLRTSFDNCNSVLNHNTNDKWIASLPFYHIGGFSIITRSLLSGTSFIIPRSLNTKDLADEINRSQPTLLSLVSTQLRRFIDLGIKPGAQLKYVLLGGGYIDASLVDSAIKEGWPVCKVYGSTETSSMVTFVNCIKEKNKKYNAGKPLANNEILIINERGAILSHNNKGEIAIKSESCAMGYFNNPKETINKFKEGIYYTGDIGFIDQEGYLYIESRMDDLIISGGENISPQDIETELLKYPGVQNVSVFGQADNEWGQIVSAAVIIMPELNISEKELKEFLLQKVSPYKVPRKIYFIKEFPMSPLGKILKEKLMDIIKDY